MSLHVSERVQEIAADIFNLPKEKITPTCSPKEIKVWDSLQHVNLVLALEQEFGLEFEPDEIQQMKSIEKIAGLVKQKLERHET